MEQRTKEVMDILQEECAEVVQEISKIFRFGIDNQHKDGIKHQEKLEMEVGDLLCMIGLMTAHRLIRPEQVELAVTNKQDKLKKWSKIYD